jgi:hypothetical protein
MAVQESMLIAGTLLNRVTLRPVGSPVLDPEVSLAPRRGSMRLAVDSVHGESPARRSGGANASLTAEAAP